MNLKNLKIPQFATKNHMEIILSVLFVTILFSGFIFFDKTGLERDLWAGASLALTTSTPLSHWKFDEGSGLTAFDSLGGNTGTLMNGPAWNTGMINKSLNFDGSNDYVNAGSPASLDNVNTFTYVAWVFPVSDGEGSYGVITNKGANSGAKRFLLNGTSSCTGGTTDGCIELSVNRATTNSTAISLADTIQYNVWQHLAVTYSPADGPRIYRNGVEVAYLKRIIGLGAEQSESSYNFTIGSWPSSSVSGTFKGRIDEVQVYGNALTATEITELYQAAPPPPTYYPPSESKGGWRSLTPRNTTPTDPQKQNILAYTGLDWDKLKLAKDYSDTLAGTNASSSAVLVIRNGWIAAEWGSLYTADQKFNIASVTKSLTGLAMGKLFDMSNAGKLAKTIDPESLAYQYLPSSFGSSNPKKKLIKIKHLMSMSSGLEPDDSTGTDFTLDGALMYPVATSTETEWVYSSLPPQLLGIVIQNVSGLSLKSFFAKNIGNPIGVQSMSWTDWAGYTYGAAGVKISARNLARVCYLTLNQGKWNNGTGDKQILSSETVSFLTNWASYLLNTTAFRAVPARSGITFATDPNSKFYYGHLFWTNKTQGALGTTTPSDAYYMHGFRDNLCVVVPSLNMVVIRLSSGGPGTDPAFKNTFMTKIMDAVVSNP